MYEAIEDQKTRYDHHISISDQSARVTRMQELTDPAMKVQEFAPVIWSGILYAPPGVSTRLHLPSPVSMQKKSKCDCCAQMQGRVLAFSSPVHILARSLSVSSNGQESKFDVWIPVIVGELEELSGSAIVERAGLSGRGHRIKARAQELDAWKHVHLGTICDHTSKSKRSTSSG